MDILQYLLLSAAEDISTGSSADVNIHMQTNVKCSIKSVYSIKQLKQSFNSEEMSIRGC